jgi:arylformamidase
MHFDAAQPGVESISLDRCIGPAEVVRPAVTGRPVTREDLPSGWTPRHSRLLLRTDSYPLDAVIDGRFAAVAADLVHWLADRGVVLLGLDTPSVDPFDDTNHPAHHALLATGMTWIENLWLGEAEPGDYFLVAVPILLVGAEAAPVRAVLGNLAMQRALGTAAADSAASEGRNLHSASGSASRR